MRCPVLFLQGDAFRLQGGRLVLLFQQRGRALAQGLVGRKPFFGRKLECFPHFLHERRPRRQRFRDGFRRFHAGLGDGTVVQLASRRPTGVFQFRNLFVIKLFP